MILLDPKALINYVKIYACPLSEQSMQSCAGPAILDIGAFSIAPTTVTVGVWRDPSLIRLLVTGSGVSVTSFLVLEVGILALGSRSPICKVVHESDLRHLEIKTICTYSL